MNTQSTSCFSSVELQHVPHGGTLLTIAITVQDGGFLTQRYIGDVTLRAVGANCLFVFHVQHTSPPDVVAPLLSLLSEYQASGRSRQKPTLGDFQYIRPTRPVPVTKLLYRSSPDNRAFKVAPVLN
jgi:hypothetical protein